MREITLNKKNTFSSGVFKMPQVSDIEEGVQRIEIPIFSIDLGEAQKKLNIAHKNGSEIIYTAIDVEDMMCDLLEYHIFKDLKSDGRTFFKYEILQSSKLSFNDKKSLIRTIIEKEDLLQGKNKNNFDKILKNVQGNRNAFAHGKLEHDAQKGVVLSYYSNGHQSKILDDAYWDMIEELFKEARELLDNLKNKLIDKYADSISAEVE